jgi:hypothetical protein
MSQWKKKKNWKKKNHKPYNKKEKVESDKVTSILNYHLKKKILQKR